MLRWNVLILSLWIPIFYWGLASAQPYPHKPIRIVTVEPGGGGDIMSRLIAPELASALGQQVVVDNRGGASGVIAAQIITNATPDGHTLLLYNNGIWTVPLLQKVPYDPVKDFSPITLAASSPNVIVVHPSVPVNSVKELIALAKSKPGELNYASGGTGSSNHLAAELFNALAGINIVRIPYKGTGPALNALIGGQAQLSFPNAAGVTAYIKSGRLKALAVTSAEPSALVPGLPTVAASGLAGYDSAATTGIFAPAKTPIVIINKLNQEIVRILNKKDVKEKLFNTGVETVGSSPQQFAAAMKAEISRMGKVIKNAGIRVD